MRSFLFVFSFFFSSRRRHTSCLSDWSSDVCSSDLILGAEPLAGRDRDPRLPRDFSHLVRHLGGHRLLEPEYEIGRASSTDGVVRLAPDDLLAGAWDSRPVPDPVRRAGARRFAWLRV